MKTIIFVLCLTASFWGWMVAEYKAHAIHPVGYSAEYRARMDELVANNTPLSVADIGIDAEQFMEGGE